MLNFREKQRALATLWEKKQLCNTTTQYMPSKEESQLEVVLA
jgi:hypothetical protein